LTQKPTKVAWLRRYAFNNFSYRSSWKRFIIERESRAEVAKDRGFVLMRPRGETGRDSAAIPRICGIRDTRDLGAKLLLDDRNQNRNNVIAARDNRDERAGDALLLSTLLVVARVKRGLGRGEEEASAIVLGHKGQPR